MIRLLLQEQSDLGLHCAYVILSETLVFEILGHLPYVEPYDLQPLFKYSKCPKILFTKISDKIT